MCMGVCIIVYTWWSGWLPVCVCVYSYLYDCVYKGAYCCMCVCICVCICDRCGCVYLYSLCGGVVFVCICVYVFVAVYMIIHWYIIHI